MNTLPSQWAVGLPTQRSPGGLSILGSPLRTGLGEGMILSTGHHTSALEHLGRMNQMQLAGDLVFSPALLTRGCWTVWPEASELPAKCLCEDTRNIFWLTNHITCLSPCPGVGRAALCLNSLCYRYIYIYLYIHSQKCELLVVVISPSSCPRQSQCPQDLSGEGQGVPSQLLLLNRLADTRVPKNWLSSRCYLSQKWQISSCWKQTLLHKFWSSLVSPKLLPWLFSDGFLLIGSRVAPRAKRHTMQQEQFSASVSLHSVSLAFSLLSRLCRGRRRDWEGRLTFRWPQFLPSYRGGFGNAPPSRPACLNCWKHNAPIWEISKWALFLFHRDEL